ncbi:hypothetical protein LOC54_08325 [Acetobacter sp. AN02]|uniref:hypothetical protein n=1 Tax=Acetobacter sp. AN02 TaxID=2894186 RepID=UPI002434606B|nr:hypothetical protein [Acetobacter sp. AN02]MDG6095115.1 hypothetical protein [Acetobacter sp. AN02]
MGGSAGDITITGYSKATSTAVLHDYSGTTTGNGNLCVQLNDGHTATFVGVTSADQLTLGS